LDPSKSQVEFYLDLCSHTIACDPLNLTSSKSLCKDIETLQFRVVYEGISFLTKVLPRLGKALDEGLVNSQFSCPREFNRSHTNKCIPAFMQEYFNCVFDNCGKLLDSASPEAVKHLRQVMYFAYKLELPYRKSEEEAVIASFINSDKEIEFVFDEESSQIIEVASFMTEEIFRDFDPKDILPRHGPGAVATGERLEEKWRFRRKYSNIHRYYPYYSYFMVGKGAELMDRLDWYKSLEPHENGTAKVVLVPKDSRGPRLISAEPLEYQWIQQGLGRKIMSHLESHWMTSGNINFTRQEINQSLALSSSQTGDFATLDLKDASDRVSLNLVKRLFIRSPLIRALEASRTTQTRLVDGKVITLNKFAPMGSALCFPVEAYVFWALSVSAVSRCFKMQRSEVGRLIYVYGDDIIVPTKWVSLVMQTLTSVGLRFNKKKCCTKGFFRESCGVDAFKGVNVTPTRLKTLWSGRKTDGSAYASYVSIANKLSHYKSLSDFLWKKLEQTYGLIPYGTKYSSFPCKVISDPIEAETRNLRFLRRRYSRRYQRDEFFLPVLLSRRGKTGLDSWPRLLRNVVYGIGVDPSSIVFPRSMIIKRGWRALY
jgi:hypothetical protein